MSRSNDGHPLPGRAGGSPGFPRWLLPVIGSIGLAVLALLLVTLSSASRRYEPEYTGGARAEVSQTVFDYSDVKNNSQVDTEFTIRNIGDRQLYFSQEPVIEVVKGCCPPQATIDRLELDPGEAATIAFSFSMHEGMDGPHDFRVKVRTNDVEEPEQEVVVLSN